MTCKSSKGYCIFGFWASACLASQSKEARGLVPPQLITLPAVSSFFLVCLSKPIWLPSVGKDFLAQRGERARDPKSLICY